MKQVLLDERRFSKLVVRDAPEKLRRHWNWKYAALLLALLSIYFVVPFLGGSSSTLPAFRFTILGVMFLCVLTVAKHRSVLVLAVILGLGSELTMFILPELRPIAQMAFFVLASCVIYYMRMRFLAIFVTFMVRVDSEESACFQSLLLLNFIQTW